MTSLAVNEAVTPHTPKRISGARHVLAKLVAGLMRLWGATIRVRAAPGAALQLEKDTAPTLFVLWHSRLFGVARIISVMRPHRSLHVLVSASRDGAWLTAFFERFGLSVVRGSSSRGGREAVQSLIRVLKSGLDAGMTPDGPRGPAEIFKAGALVVARRAKVRVVLLGINYSSYWRVNSWDKLIIPKPFSCVTVLAEVVPMELLDSEDALPMLERRLRVINSDPVREPAIVI